MLHDIGIFMTDANDTGKYVKPQSMGNREGLRSMDCEGRPKGRRTSSRQAGSAQFSVQGTDAEESTVRVKTDSLNAPEYASRPGERSSNRDNAR